MNPDDSLLPFHQDDMMRTVSDDEQARAQGILLKKFQELEAREHKVSAMWAKIQNWEAHTEDMRLRTEKAEEQARQLARQLASAEERAAAAEAYVSWPRPHTPAVETTRKSPLDPLTGGAFAPDADSSMRHEPESPVGLTTSGKGKEREELPYSIDDRHQDADDEDTDEEERDAVMNDLQSTSRAVQFAAMKFPRSTIGAGPSLRLKTTTGRENNAERLPNSLFRNVGAFPAFETNTNGHPVPSSTLEQAVIALTGCVTKLTEQMSHLPRSSIDQAQRKKKYGTARTTIFKLPPQRHTTPQRNDQLRAVRDIMNTLLDIKHDADIVHANEVKEDVIVAYEEERGPGPSPPYAPDWASIEGPWNYALLEIFMEAYTEKYIVIDGGQQEEICKMFMDRLRRLKKKVKQATRRIGETNMQMNQRLITQHRRVLANQRRNSRRNERFSVRSRITVQNAASQCGDGRVIWEHLDELVATLGAGGMSSDESDIDDDGQKIYFAKKMSWRRLGLVARMITVDRDRNFKNCYENVTGNAPRPRKRRVNATETLRRPIPGLPVNFYDDMWYDGLDEVQKGLLGAKPALDLIEFQRVEG